MPVIAVSDGSDDEEREKCVAAGADEFLEPPFNRSTILLRLRNATRAKDSVTFREMEIMLRELPSNIYLKNAEGKYIFSSHYWHHLEANATSWTIRGKTEFDIQKDPKIAAKAYEADMKIITEKKSTSYIIDLNTNGVQEYIQVTKSPTYDANGNVSGIIAIMTDVTELEMLKRKLEDRTEAIGAELRVAAQIQGNMMPTDFMWHDDTDIHASMTPAKNVGGDFYDFYFIDDTHLAITIADVSGKGVPAALFMVISKIVMHDRALTGGTPAEILSDANDRICESNKMGLFVTVWFGILDLDTGIITYANAGHEYPALKRGNGKYELVVSDNFPPVGTVEGIGFTDNTIDVSDGASLFMYTDGVTDANDTDGKRFGDARLTELLNSGPERSPQEMISFIKKQIDIFGQGTEQFDDITMMGIKYKGRSAARSCNR